MRFKSIIPFCVCSVVLLVGGVSASFAWTNVGSGTTGDIRGIWGSSSSDLWAIYDGTLSDDNLLHFNGKTWAPVKSHTLRGYAIWGSASSNIFVVGEGVLSDSSPIERFNGSTWSAMNPSSKTRLNAVWGSSASNVIAVGENGTVLRYNGRTWASMYTPTTYSLNGVWGSSATDIFAVGDRGRILHYDGSAWSLMNSGVDNYLYGVWGNSPRNVYAVGSSGTILHYDGTSWTSYAGSTGNSLYAIWGASSTDIFAVGSRGMILQYNGYVWTDVSFDSPSTLKGIWGQYAPNGLNLYAVGDGGLILRHVIPSKRTLPRSSPINDGILLESSENSNLGGSINAAATTIRLGDDGINRQYRSIVSFDTSSVPVDATIISAKLKLRFQSMYGLNPFMSHGNILVDVMKGSFSNDPLLQANDFQAVPTKTAAAVILNKPTAGWYSTTIAQGYVNRKGLTQLRLRFAKDDDNDKRPDYLSFYSGNAAMAYQPVLEIYYLPRIIPEHVYFPSPKTWADAKSYCESLGGHLAVLETPAESDQVKVLIGIDATLAWIGGFQKPDGIEPAGGWTWVTGEPISWFNWGSGNPNNAGRDEDCLVMIGPGYAEQYPPLGGMGDYKCSLTLGFICELK